MFVHDAHDRFKALRRERGERLEEPRHLPSVAIRRDAAVQAPRSVHLTGASAAHPAAALMKDKRSSQG